MIAPAATVSSDSLDFILCYYVNPTATLQTAVLTTPVTAHFERLVFPQQRLLFEAPLEAQLEIRTRTASGAIEIVQIPCVQLQVNQRDLMHSVTLAHIFDSATQTLLGEE